MISKAVWNGQLQNLLWLQKSAERIESLTGSDFNLPVDAWEREPFKGCYPLTKLKSKNPSLVWRGC